MLICERASVNMLLNSIYSVTRDMPSPICDHAETAVGDCIHGVDLADMHIRALRHPSDGGKSVVVNPGASRSDPAAVTRGAWFWHKFRSGRDADQSSVNIAKAAVE